LLLCWPTHPVSIPRRDGLPLSPPSAGQSSPWRGLLCSDLQAPPSTRLRSDHMACPSSPHPRPLDPVRGLRVSRLEPVDRPVECSEKLIACRYPWGTQRYSHAPQPSRVAGSRRTAQPAVLFGLFRLRPGQPPGSMRTALSSSGTQTGSTWLCTRSGRSSRRRRSGMPASGPQSQLTCARCWNAWRLMASPSRNGTMNRPTWRSSAWTRTATGSRCTGNHRAASDAESAAGPSNGESL